MSTLDSDRYQRLCPVPRRRALTTLAITAFAAFQLVPALAGMPPVVALVLLPLIAAVVYACVPVRLLPVAGDLEADAEGVRWNGELIAPRGQILAGLVVPGAGGPLEVRLVRRSPRRPVSFVVPDEETARALLRELGLDASQMAVSLPFGSRLRASVAGTLLWALSLLAMPISLLIAALVAAFAPSLGTAVAAGLLALAAIAWTTLNLAGSTLRIGADGILVSWLGRTSFVAYDDLQDIRPYVDNGGAGIVLRLRSGGEMRLPRMGAFTMALDRRELDLVVHRVQQAVEQQQRAQVDRGLVLPERGGRPSSAWIAALRSVGTGARSDHRTAPVAADRLLRIAEDPGAAPEMRVAAAVALGGVGDDASRARLRIAAEATAEPELRAAMALAAEEDAAEEELGAALDRLVQRRAS